MELFSGNDIATEILSRLPIETLMAFKCTATRWYSFVSDPLFLRIYYQRSKQITVLVMQNMLFIRKPYDLRFDSIDLFTPTKTGYDLNYNLLDFLPEKVIVLTSSNGILCCQSWVDLNLRGKQRKTVTYICNPLTTQWVQFRSNGNLAPGFAFYPSYASNLSGSADSIFKLVNIIYNGNQYSSSYLFDIYSSDTKKWKRSKAVAQASICAVKDGGYPTRVVFANGWFHWWTIDFKIVAFHVEKELCKVIKLARTPAQKFHTYHYKTFCWGESEGYFHYVFAYGPEIQVWVLKNYEEEEKHAWELKYSLDFVRFCDQHPVLRGKSWLHVLTFHEDVLYILSWDESVDNLVSYDFRTKTLINHGDYVRQLEMDPNSTIVFPFQSSEGPIVIPFSASLVPLQGVRRSKRIRKRKLLEI